MMTSRRLLSAMLTPSLAHVQAVLQLTQEQVAAMVEARREFLASLKALLQQRRALNAIIGASVIKDLDSNPAVSVQHNKARQPGFTHKPSAACTLSLMRAVLALPGSTARDGRWRTHTHASRASHVKKVVAPYQHAKFALVPPCSAWRWCTCWSATRGSSAD